MKKFFVSLVMLLSASAASLFAQSSLIATLSHDGEITAFYGADALKEAHEAAVHGDVVTLSSGTFMATDITKAITLRGAGMQLDTINNILPSIIMGEYAIKISDDVVEKLTIEGIYHNDVVRVKGNLACALFLKNRFSTFTFSETDPGYLINSNFIHCKITNYFTLNNNNSSCSFINSYVRKLRYYRGQNISSSMKLVNSILKATDNNDNYGGYLSQLTNAEFSNCIIIARDEVTDGDWLPSSSTAYYCVALNSKNLCFENIPNTSTNSYSSYSELFKYYTGVYDDNITFELTDDAKTKFLGIDDTQVGIYGGDMPFSPFSEKLRITKYNVASKSTADGKLSVDIEVSGIE